MKTCDRFEMNLMKIEISKKSLSTLTSIFEDYLNTTWGGYLNEYLHINILQHFVKSISFFLNFQ
jgi:hypothetical protein